MDLPECRGRAKDVDGGLGMKEDMDPDCKAIGEDPLGLQSTMKRDGR